MKLTLKNVTHHPEISGAIKELYKEAFPIEEQMPYWALRWRSSKGGARLCGVFDGPKLVGMVSFLTEGNFLYLMYLAVAEQYRDCGYGSAILNFLKERYPQWPIMICVEPMDPQAKNFAQRQRRWRFYERHGFVKQPFRVKEGIVVFDVLTCGGTVQPAWYMNLMKRFVGPLRMVFHPKVLD